jgi:hypothetical protein
MKKQDLTEEIKRVTSEIAADAAAKALEVSSTAAARASEVATAATAEAARVSTLAIAKALDAATLAATKAAEAAAAASAVASSTSGDIGRIKEDIIKINLAFDKINDKLDNKYVTKEEFSIVKNIVYGMVGLILISFIGGLIVIVMKPQTPTYIQVPTTAAPAVVK